MIFNLNIYPPPSTPKTYDACIIGAGVAGITLAIQLAAMGRHVLLLEAGDLDYSIESQDVYKGTNIGRPYFKLNEDRLRFLGGTSNHWAGWCRPLDARDFMKHDHIPNSGWPIKKTDLDKYHSAASAILEIPENYNDFTLPDSNGTLKKIEFQFSPPVRFGKKYQEELLDSTKIDVFINANVTDIRLNESLDRVTDLHVQNYTTPETSFKFSAKTFVLATGGIENARLLLNFHNQIPAGIGNTNDLVGRYFMDHFSHMAGHYVTDVNSWPFGKNKEIYFSPTSKKLSELKMANTSLRDGSLYVPKTTYEKVKQRLVCANDMMHEFIDQFHHVWCPSTVYTGGYMHVASEQTPNPNSRVSLSNEKDKFGLQRANLDWQIQSIDRYTIKRTATLFGEYLAANRIGNVKLIHWLQNDTDPVPGVGEDSFRGAGSHHMGTTRMTDSNTTGVVDKNCQVFGINNFFIAGSSVFPTGGHANPTFTIVQLALRLSEHINDSLKTTTHI